MWEWSIHPRGLHNKCAERFIREVKEKSNAVRARLSYDLPRKLLFELYAFTVDMINMVLNTQTLIAVNEIENKSVDQLLAGTFENVRDGVTYPGTDARQEVTPSPYIHAYRTSVTKALKQPDGPRKDAVIKAIRDEVQQIIDVGAIAPARFESLSEEEQKKIIPSHLFVTLTPK
jgi:hypothetical protein